MRWWRLAATGALLLWVLGTAYLRARQRNRELGLAVLLAGAGVIMIVSSALLPRPPVTVALASVLLVGAVMALAGSVMVILLKGFRD